MRRRKFITLLGGTVAVWPLAAHAQQPKMLPLGLSHANCCSRTESINGDVQSSLGRSSAKSSTTIVSHDFSPWTFFVPAAIRKFK